MSYNKYDLIHIVGGGAAGISSAYFLIESGHDANKIKIFEKSKRIGGHLCTVYFHIINNKDCRIITEYSLKYRENKVFLTYNDDAGYKHTIDLDNENIVPADMLATVHGRKRFHNLYTMAKREGLLPLLITDDENYTITCRIEEGTYTSYNKYNPFWLKYHYNLHIKMKKIYSSKAKQYMQYNPGLTYGQLLKYLCIDWDDPCLLPSHSTIPCLFALSIDDMFNADSKIISESTEKIMGNSMRI